MARHLERQKERDNLACFRGPAAVHAGGAGSACNLQGRKGEREEVEARGRGTPGLQALLQSVPACDTNVVLAAVLAGACRYNPVWVAPASPSRRQLFLLRDYMGSLEGGWESV